MDEKNKKSRKWFLAKLLVFITTVGTFLPPLLSEWFLGKSVVILDGTQFVSLTTLIYGSYIAGNCIEKHLVLKSGIEAEKEL